MSRGRRRWGEGEVNNNIPVQISVRLNIICQVQLRCWLNRRKYQEFMLVPYAVPFLSSMQISTTLSHLNNNCLSLSLSIIYTNKQIDIIKYINTLQANDVKITKFLARFYHIFYWRDVWYLYTMRNNQNDVRLFQNGLQTIKDQFPV